MKAFIFRLDQALRWRATQVDVEKAKVAAAGKVLADIQSEIAQREAELKEQSTALVSNRSDGATLIAWSSWQKRCHATILKLRTLERHAEAALAAEMTKLVEANRQWQLIDNLKTTRKAKWTADFDKELESFAAESFLGRLQSKRTGA